ncbi:MAG: ATP phosphoribosyltransferase regulatory subunit [Wolinella sp.]
MILEHEIPQGSQLYFGTSAQLKRHIEARASEILCKAGFLEICTPAFAYLEHQNSNSSREVLRLSSEKNNQIALRNDTTLDVARIITKRLGRSTEHRKWFYIQPVFSYPTTEIHQIGAESLGEQNARAMLDVALNILRELEIFSILQLSNMQIPLLCARESGLSIEVFSKMQVENLLSRESYFELLLKIRNIEDLRSALGRIPSFLKEELERLFELSSGLEYDHVVIAPLYYAPMDYYDGIVFRMFERNSTLLFGGNYEIDGLKSCGFGLYTDELVLLKNEDK